MKLIVTRSKYFFIWNSYLISFMQFYNTDMFVSRNSSGPRKSKKKKEQKMFGWKKMHELIEKLCRRISYSRSWPVQKLSLYNLVWKIPNVFKLLGKKIRQANVSGYRPDWLVAVVVDPGFDFIQQFRSSFLIKKTRVRFRSCHIFIMTFEISNSFWILCVIRLTRKHWDICIFDSNWILSGKSCHFQISVWRDGAAFFCRQYPTDNSLLHSRKNLETNKRHVRN